MALATVTSNSYGFRATGGTDATPITTYKARVKSFMFKAAGAADTCAITDKDGKAIFTFTSLGSAGDIEQIFFDDSPVEGFSITLSDAGGLFIAIIC
jgi:hypothetical protein